MRTTFILASIFIVIAAASANSALAYRQPVSNQFMPPYCPLLANGEKNPACLYIPKAQCDYFVSKQGNDIRRILNGNQDWSNVSQFIEAFRAESE